MLITLRPPVGDDKDGMLYAVAFSPDGATLAVGGFTGANRSGNYRIVGLIGFATIAAAWSGFQYRFLRHGVEIRSLGFRLRSIPRQQIQSYAPESWSLVRGYGIRGIGNTRAYVWGNKVVHIKTSNGDVFLGHSDPDRIVRDLDRVMSH